MRFIAVHSPTPMPIVAWWHKALPRSCWWMNTVPPKAWRDTLESYCQLNNLGYSAEPCAAGVELSCTHGVVTTFTIIN